MTELLDLPTIAEEPAVVEPAAQTAIADPAKVDLQAVALAHFGDWRGDVATARRELSTLALDLTIPARIAEAKTLRQRLIGAPRAEVRKVATALKSRLASVSKAVGSEADAAVAAYDDAEKLITPQIDAAEARIEAERAEKARIEADRIAGLKAKVDAIMSSWLARCSADGMTAERIAGGIAALGQATVPDDLQEVAAYFAEAHGRTVVKMAELKLQAAQREEAARLEAERAEQRRQAEELARQRAELEAQAQALRDEAARLQREKDAAEERAREQERSRLAAEAHVAAVINDGVEQAAVMHPHAVAPLSDSEPAQPVVQQATHAAPQIVRAAVAPAANEPATVKLGDLADTLGFPLRADFIETVLGIKPAGRDRAAILYRSRQVPDIVSALQQHLARVHAGLSKAA